MTSEPSGITSTAAAPRPGGTSASDHGRTDGFITTPHSATSHSTTNLSKEPLKVSHNTLKGPVSTECTDKTSKVETETKNKENFEYTSSPEY